MALHGVNRSGTEFLCVQGRGIFDGPSGRASVSAMKSWGINAVRIPLNEACWNGEPYVDPAYAGANYQSAIRTYVNLLNANGMVAMPEGPGVVVYGSMQCPFYVQKAVASALGCDLNHARIVQTVTGGGFGGKEDAPSAPGAQAALLARATGRPVRFIFTREEDMAVMSKRHPGRIRMRTGWASALKNSALKTWSSAEVTKHINIEIFEYSQLAPRAPGFATPRRCLANARSRA